MNQLTVSRSRSWQIRRQHFRATNVAGPSFDTATAAQTIAGRHWANSYRNRLAVSDLSTITAAVVVAFIARFGLAEPQSFLSPHLTGFSLMSLAVIATWGTGLAVFRTRDPMVTGVGSTEYRRVINATSSTFGLLAILFLVAQADTARWFVTVSLPLGVGGLVIGRWLWRQWLNAERTAGHFHFRVVVVGRRRDVEKVVLQIRASSGAAYTVVGAVLDDNSADGRSGPLHDVSVISGLERVADYATALGANGVVVAGQPKDGSDFIHDLAWDLEGRTMELILATSLANVAGPRVHFRPVDGLPLLHVEIPQFEGGKHALKRVLDIVVSGLALVAIAPLSLVLAILIRLDSPGPAFFSQERVGRGGDTFRILKFRSMVSDAPTLQASLAASNDSRGLLFKMRNDPRVTRIGRVLRKYSLDELPQFWNVFMGDMSLVGPRPPLKCEVDGYEDHVHRRLYIKPGLTGMWQVNGRSELSWEESVRLDLYYVENWSITGDLIIMWRTFKVIVHPVGAY
jgi:exopolysaccharide biosynthesis polyprenyl glycosylphosphotransferase